MSVVHGCPTCQQSYPTDYVYCPICKRKLRNISPQPPEPFGNVPITSEEGVRRLMPIVFNEHDLLKLPRAYPNLITVANVLGHLEYREREIVKLRLGLDGQGVRHYRVIGEHFKITSSWARTIFERAMRKLRDSGQKRVLGASWYGPFGGLSFLEWEEMQAELPYGPPAPLVVLSVVSEARWQRIQKHVFTESVERSLDIHVSVYAKPSRDNVQKALDQLSVQEAQLLIRLYELAWNYWDFVGETSPAAVAASLGIYSLEEFWVIHNQAITKLQTVQTWKILNGKPVD